MRRTLLILALALSTSSAFAGGVEAPPARYDYEPRSVYTLLEINQNKLNRMCKGPLAAVRATGQKANVVGCSLPELGMIFILDSLQGKLRREVIAHEKAHLNGWVH